MSLPLANIRLVARERQAAVVDFTGHIVRIPSLPGQENQVAPVIVQEMQALGYDEVWTDEAGNVVGKISGGNGPAILLNGHMDHVDPGPAEGWPYSPFSGQVVNGELWGRASVDMKGPVACMIYAASLLKQLDLTPPGPVYVTVAVMEETGGLGTQHLISYLRPATAICGEPSRNILRRGHRGRIELMVTFKGRSAHASVPHLSVNPHYQAASFMAGLPRLVMVPNETLGPASVAPTLYKTDQSSPNVTPSQVCLTLDWRNVPDESADQVVAKVQDLLDASYSTEEERQNWPATVRIVAEDAISYTGLTKTLPAVFPSFLLASDNPFLRAAHAALVEALGRDEGIDIWRFATDGGHLMAAGIPTVGFGPGDERLAHTNQERISLAQMEEAVVAYTALILALAEAAAA